MNYYKRIDGLRFFAIFFVLIEHFANLLAKHISAGYFGVDLFFVISGFLITSILLRENNNSFKKNYFTFLGRRTLRIFPLYYLTLLLLWIINVDDIRSYMLYLVSYTANYGMVLHGWPHAPILHFWSLSVEEQFYLFWPLMILTLKARQAELVIIILAIILLGYAQLIYNIFPGVSKYNYWGLFPRMASLAMGGLGTLIYKSKLMRSAFFSNKKVEWCFLILLLLSLFIPSTFKTLLMGICSLYMVLKAAGNGFKIKPFDRILSNKHIVYIGTISYGIYIFHPIIGMLFTKYIFDPVWMNIEFEKLGFLKIVRWHSWAIKFPLYSFLSIFLASLSYKYFEMPILNLKNRWFPING